MRSNITNNLWSGYNREEYLRRLVNFEERYRTEPYPRPLIPDTNDYTKQKGIWWNTQDFFKSLIV